MPQGVDVLLGHGLRDIVILGEIAGLVELAARHGNLQEHLQQCRRHHDTRLQIKLLTADSDVFQNRVEMRNIHLCLV
jgi:hypothetical protein